MLLEIKESVPVNSILEVTMIITYGNSKREVILPGEVIRSDKKGTALKLMKLNLESLTIIKDILLQNHNDPEQIVTEFSNFFTREGAMSY